MARNEADHGPARYRPFGALRFLLATLVVAQHAIPILPAAVARAVGPLEVGSIAVLCFFVVSGYVISEAAATVYPGRPAAFLANRVLRLYPTYLVALVVSALVMSLAASHFVPGVGETPMAAARFALPTVLVNTLALFPFWKLVESHLSVPEILEQGWALRVEFLFYGVVAFGLLVATRLRIGLTPVLASCGLALLASIVLAPNHLAGTALENTPYFVLGAALFWLRPGTRRRWGAALLGLGAGVLIVVQMAARPATFGVANFFRDRLGEAILLAVLTLLMIGLSFVRLRRRRLMGIDRLLGELTYPLYLLHSAVLVAVKTAMPHASLLSTLVAFGSSLAVSWLALVAVEQPVGQIRARLRRGRAEAAHSRPDFPLAQLS